MTEAEAKQYNEAIRLLNEFRESANELDGMRMRENVKLTGARIDIDEAELDRINAANPTASFTMEAVGEKRIYAVEAVD